MAIRKTLYTYEQLWQGAILATIAHAIWVAQDALLAYEQSWDGTNYCLQNTMGARGTIAFREDQLVGVFFDAHSDRSPFTGAVGHDPHLFFDGMPRELDPLAHEALEYMLDEYNGTTAPIITTAIWSMGKFLTAVEPWEEVTRHGGHLIRVHLLPPRLAIAEWQQNYEMDFAQIALLGSLFGRRIAATSPTIQVEPWEYDIITAYGTDGLDTSRELFAAIGIILP